jgi:DNA polymerase-1
VIPAVFSEPPAQLSRSEVFEVLRPVFLNTSIKKIGHNVKFDARSVSKYLGQVPPGPYVDTMIQQFVLDENLREYSLTSLIAANFGSRPYDKEGKLGAIIDDVAFDAATRYVHLDARWTWVLYRELDKRIQRSPSLQTALDLDMQVLHALMDTENVGIQVDTRRMKQLGKELDLRKQQLLLDISQYAFLGFNPDSVGHKKQLLFNKKREGGLGLTPVGKTKTGASSVDEATLVVLKDKHPVVPMLLEWAEASKLKSTYVDGLLPLLNKGRLHPSFNLHRAATGRLSSSNPNLQNIPRGSDLRGLFVAPTGQTLLVADYDQIELRVMCMFSHDPKMSKFFLENIDIHAGAASLILGKPLGEISSEERQIGKMVNFLTGFGGGAFNLAQKTGISEDRARAFIDDYYRQFAGLAKWKEQIKDFARRKGYVETLYGRRRRLPDIRSDDSMLRARAERQAVNAVIQGTAADICKEAMVKVHTAFANTPADLLVQVHDELVCSTSEDFAEEAMTLLTTSMGHETIIEGIPLLVSAHSGHSWAEAKG